MEEQLVLVFQASNSAVRDLVKNVFYSGPGDEDRPGDEEMVDYEPVEEDKPTSNNAADDDSTDGKESIINWSEGIIIDIGYGKIEQN